MKHAISTLLLRSLLGITLFAHGLLKILVFTMAGTVAYFESLGFPAIFAYLTAYGEVALGLALIVGLFTRLAAMASLPILIGASWVHSANGWVFSNQGGGWEFPISLVIMALIVAIQGGGSLVIKKHNSELLN